MALVPADIGHQRAQNKPADGTLLIHRIQAFFDHYVKGTGPQPPMGVTALTQTCPSSAPSLGPYTAATWAALHPGEVDYSSKPAQTILSAGGDPTISRTSDPVTGGLACTTAPATDQGPGVATYRLPAATGAGYTLLGSPAVTADLNVTGEFAYVASRLLDVDPATNTETLVARGVYRIDPNVPNGRQVFQLHPGAWHFAAGHVPKLELLGQDSPYTRASNGVFSISVSNLSLRLPVHETRGAPGAPPGVNRPPRVRIQTGRAFVSHGRPEIRLACGGARAGTCSGTLSLTTRKRTVSRIHHRRKVSFRPVVLAHAGYTIAGGHSHTVTLRLSSAALELLAHARHDRLHVDVAATLTGGRPAHRTSTLQRERA